MNKAVMTSVDHLARMIYAMTASNPQPWIYLTEDQKNQYRKMAEAESERALVELAQERPTDFRPDKEYLVIYRSERSFHEKRSVFTAKSARLLLDQVAADEVDRNDGVSAIHIELIREKPRAEE